MKKCFLSTKNNKNKTPWFLFFCLISIIYISFAINLWYLFFLIIPLLNNKIIRNLKNFLLFIIIAIVFGIYIFLLKKIQFKFILSNLLIFKLNDVIKQKIYLFLEAKYENELASFIKLILLNIKTNNTYSIFNQSVDLGIAWLFQSSGYHLHILINIIMLIFKRNIKIRWIISILISFSYVILLKVSYAILKILLDLLLSKLFFKFHIDKLNITGIIGLIICTINPLCFADYGFILSILISLISIWLKTLCLNNKIIEQLIFSFTIQLVGLPIIMEITTKISLLSVISSLIFYYVIAFIFLYFLIFSWFPFMITIHKSIVYIFNTLIGNVSFNNLYINSFKWHHSWIFMYYAIMYELGKITTYLFKNK